MHWGEGRLADRHRQEMRTKNLQGQMKIDTTFTFNSDKQTQTATGAAVWAKRNEVLQRSILYSEIIIIEAALHLK